jgi:hypothetical protein
LIDNIFINKLKTKTTQYLPWLTAYPTMMCKSLLYSILPFQITRMNSIPTEKLVNTH